MLGERKPAFGSAPVPVSSQPREGNAWTRFDRWWLLFVAVIILTAALILFLPEPFRRIFVFIQDGIWITLRLTIISFVSIVVVGMIMGLFRVSSIAPLRAFASLYVEIVRGIPVLVWLLWIYFALPGLLNTRINDFTAAVVGFTVAYGAYMTEVFRAGIQSISKGQMEAARSLGMSYIEAMRYIVLPQAFRVILPPMGNEFVTLLKDTSLVSVLGVSDLTRRGREFVARSFLSFDTFAMVALVYLILTLFFTRVSSAIERRWAVEKR